MNNSFSMQAGTGSTSSASPEVTEARATWRKYQFEQFRAKTTTLPNGKLRKSKKLIGKVNFIMDLGFPIASDSEWDTKCTLPENGEEYSPSELKWKEENPTHDFIWTKQYDETANGGRGGSVTVRKQTSPSYPAREFGIAIDFPQIMIDYSKDPDNSLTEETLRPYRISLNNVFNRQIQRPIVFDGSYKPISDKNIVYKVALAAGLIDKLIASNFDIGTVAGAVCSFSVRMDMTQDENCYLNDAVSKPEVVDDLEMPDDSVYTADAQISKVMSTEGICDFCGILLDGMQYTEDMFKMIGYDKFGYLARASTSVAFNVEGISKKTGKEYSIPKGFNFADTDFAKAYYAYKGETPSQSSPSKEETPPESKPEQVPSKPVTPLVEVPVKEDVPEPSMDFDDTIPF